MFRCSTLCSVVFVASSATAMAQTAVDVGVGGVNVKTGDTEVTTGAGGVEVKTPGAGVTTTGDAAAESSAATANGGTRKEPLTCKENEELTLTNLTIDSATVGIVAEGNCVLTITNATIKAKQQAVKLSGNATVTLVNATIAGKKAALDLSGNATLTIESCTVTGKVAKKGNATLNKKGTNKITKG